MNKSPKQYTVNDGNFYPGRKSTTSKVLPAGAYTCEFHPETGVPFLKPFEIKCDKIIDISGSITNQVVEEVRNYWSKDVSAKFEQYGIVQKRGVLLHGVQGSGKSITLNKVARMAMEELDAVTLFNPHPDYITFFVETIREIEPNKKIIIMLEEFEDLLMRRENTLLSILDGQIQITNVLYLATTNYISKIPARIKNRPSRFARVIEFVAPTEEMRRIYLNEKLHESDKVHLEAMVELTDGLVLDQIKDIIVSVCCFGHSLADAVAKIRVMNENNNQGMVDYEEQMYRAELAKQELRLGKALQKSTPSTLIAVKPPSAPKPILE